MDTTKIIKCARTLTNNKTFVEALNKKSNILYFREFPFEQNHHLLVIRTAVKNTFYFRLHGIMQESGLASKTTKSVYSFGRKRSRSFWRLAVIPKKGSTWVK